MASIFQRIGRFFTGTPEKRKRVPTLLPNQQPLANQLFQAAQSPGAGGAFGQAADFYRSNLSDVPEDLQSFYAPELRRFNENIIPDLAEQFAGMGSGGLSSSGFRNAAVNAGTDLAERLGAIRAQLRQQSAQGLMGLGQTGLQNFSQDVMTRQGTPGFLGSALGTIGSAALAPIGGALGNSAGNWLMNRFGSPSVGKNTSPYGNAGLNAANVGSQSLFPRGF